MTPPEIGLENVYCHHFPLADVNEKLELGLYFFMDIVREGIVLHEEPGYPFAEPRPLSPAEALQETRDYYEE